MPIEEDSADTVTLHGGHEGDSGGEMAHQGGGDQHDQESTTSNIVEEATLYLTPLNDTFTRKAVLLLANAEPTKIGRKVNSKTSPESGNAYFDAKVLSRTHAQIEFANGKVMLSVPEVEDC